MLVITRNKLKFLHAGRALTIPDPAGRYRKGRTYALGTSHNRAICRVLVIDAPPGAIRVQLAAVDAPRFLARNPVAQRADYVTDPHDAMRDEPEAVDHATQDHLTELGTVRWGQLNALRANQAALMALQDRADRLERAHAWGHTDFTSELRLIRAQIRDRQERPV